MKKKELKTKQKQKAIANVPQIDVSAVKNYIENHLWEENLPTQDIKDEYKIRESIVDDLWNHKICHFCGSAGGSKNSSIKKAKLKVCSRCYLVFYCNEECQKSDYSDNHKFRCCSKKQPIPADTSAYGNIVAYDSKKDILSIRINGIPRIWIEGHSDRKEQIKDMLKGSNGGGPCIQNLVMMYCSKNNGQFEKIFKDLQVTKFVYSSCDSLWRSLKNQALDRDAPNLEFISSLEEAKKKNPQSESIQNLKPGFCAVWIGVHIHAATILSSHFSNDLEERFSITVFPSVLKEK
jgi:hypothetical protein